jgi:hypothetical protein
LQGSSGYLLLTRTDTGTDEDSAFATSLQDISFSFFYLLRGETTRALHLSFHGVVKQEAIPHSLHGDVCHCDSAHAGEKFWVLSFQEQASWVVCQVVYHVLKLPLVGKQAIIVAWFPKETMGSTCCGVAGRLGWLRY